MIIPENIKYAIEILSEKGFEAYMVGGCVRDMLMGKKPSDFDITTNARPEEIKECFSDKKMVLSGMKHGTVAPIINYEAVEITTYRIDGEYKDSRHPEEVFFTRSLTEDLKRRDFTVNAMAMDEDFNIIDPFLGREDIEKGIIRCVGNAEERFYEDALRIMRALRFSSTLGFIIEEETKNAILKLYQLLSNIAAERIFTELKKLLSGKRAPEVLEEYKEIMLFIMPELSLLPEEKYMENVKRIKGCNPSISFALLLDGLKKEDARDIFNYLRTDRLLKDTVLKLMEDKNSDITDIYKMRRFLRENEPESVKRLIRFKFESGVISEKEKIKAEELLLEASSSCVKIKDLKISGRELLEMGFTGTKIGAVLERLLDLVTEDKLENEKNALKNAAKSLVNRY